MKVSCYRGKRKETTDLRAFDVLGDDAVADRQLHGTGLGVGQVLEEDGARLAAAVEADHVVLVAAAGRRLAALDAQHPRLAPPAHPINPTLYLSQRCHVTAKIARLLW